MNPFDEHLAKYREKGIEYLRVNIPELQRVEALDDLQDLRLIRQTDIGTILMLQYETTAPTLFPAVRQRLLDREIAKKHNMLHTSLKNKGTSNEIYNVTMGFYSNKLQISLNIHK